MNPLHSHDIFENLLDTVVHPLDVEGYQLGSDPLTHKKMRENTNKGSNTAGSSSASGSSNQSTSTNDQNSTKEDSSTSKMDETKDLKESSKSGQ